MLIRYFTAALMFLILVVFASDAWAQRGGRGGGGGGGRGGGGPGGGGFGGGGGQRGGPGGGGGFGGGGFGGGGGQRGGPGGGGFGGGGFGGGGFGGGAEHGGGGFGGGLSFQGGMGGEEHGAAGGPYGRGGAGMTGNQFAEKGPRPGVGAGGAGGPDSGAGVRPGVGAGASGAGLRPGVGAGGAGGPASGVGVRPGVGTGGAGGPASGIGFRPGMGAGAAGVPGGYGGYGTHYASTDALAAQGAAFHAGAVGYAAYNPTWFAGYTSAWQPTNLTTASLYTHPGYNALAVGLKMAPQPIAYDYGANIVAQPTAVYVNGDAAGTPQEYANQAGQLAAAGQAAQPAADSKWLPLGLFAIVEGDQTSSDDVFQLAVNPQGIIRGNYHNVRSDQVVSLAGSVDRTTQKAAWTIGGDQTPVYEAGVANLTKDQTPMLVHLGDGQTHQVTLIRLQQPSQ